MKKKKPVKQVIPPFEITLTLSGGGFRAAAFHLGVLTYLEHSGLLKHVKVLSTVSGGTLTGLRYAQSLRKGIPYKEYYAGMYSFLRDVDLVDMCLQNLGKQSTTALGYKNAITSVAEIYDEVLFNGDRFELFWNDTKTHLNDVVFNSTEFRTGIDFRFQKSERRKNIKIGNNNVQITKEEAKQIRLADIAAASSCFPGGFEPIAFPYDFQWPENVIPPSLKEKFPKPLPIMDGGIYDNQGMDAAMKSTKNGHLKKKIIIISDTERRNPDLYPYPENKKFINVRIAFLNYTALALMVLSFCSIGAMLAAYLYHASAFTLSSSLFLFILPIITFSIFLGVFVYLWVKIRTLLMMDVPDTSKSVWQTIRNLTLDQVMDMIQLRASSLLSLTSSVFMKRIRQMGYTTVMKGKELGIDTISNIIYELDGTKKKRQPSLNPSSAIQDSTAKAAAMPTTLWFTSPDRQDQLIACGEYTICYNLLDYFSTQFEVKTRADQEWLKKITDQLKADWNQFQTDPLIMTRLTANAQ